MSFNLSRQVSSRSPIIRGITRNNNNNKSSWLLHPASFCTNPTIRMNHQLTSDFSQKRQYHGYQHHSNPSSSGSATTAILISVASAIAGFASTGYIAHKFELLDFSLECEPAPSDLLIVEDKSLPISKRMEALVKSLQAEVVGALQKVDGKVFLHDSWTRREGGYGTSCVLQDGNVFEKAGVNISVIQSPAPKAMIQHMRARQRADIDPSKDYDMFVAGISMVVHPHNPMAPTFHANYRYFELRYKGSSPETPAAAAWFGGGCDLTPCYLFPEDAVHFHSVIKNTCDKHDPSYYPKFKAWCDTYFSNTHRGERRGVGGIFFDDLEDKPAPVLFEFVKDCGRALTKQYIPIVEKRKDMPFTPEQKRWQQIRRGRYVEFNLVHDRGTKFGLVTPGVRIESVLMSLPLTARWEYQHAPEKGSKEEELLNTLKETPARNWV